MPCPAPLSDLAKPVLGFWCCGCPVIVSRPGVAIGGCWFIASLAWFGVVPIVELLPPREPLNCFGTPGGAGRATSSG